MHFADKVLRTLDNHSQPVEAFAWKVAGCAAPLDKMRSTSAQASPFTSRMVPSTTLAAWIV